MSPSDLLARMQPSGAFGQVVRELRLARKMPQFAMAKFSGVGSERIAQLEAGSELPNAYEVAAIATVLQLSAEDLVLRTEGAKSPSL